MHGLMQAHFRLSKLFAISDSHANHRPIYHPLCNL